MIILTDGFPPDAWRGEGTLLVNTMRDGMELAAIAASFTGQGSTCDPTCRYDETPASAIVDVVQYTPASDPCEAVAVSVDATLIASPGVDELSFFDEVMVPSACIEALGLAGQREVPAMFMTITNGGCAPTYGRLDLDLSPCEAICPTE